MNEFDLVELFAPIIEDEFQTMMENYVTVQEEIEEENEGQSKENGA